MHFWNMLGRIVGCLWFDFSSYIILLSVGIDISVPAVFEPYKDSKVDLLGPKLLFIALNLGGLALGVWKVSF